MAETSARPTAARPTAAGPTAPPPAAPAPATPTAVTAVTAPAGQSSGAQPAAAHPVARVRKVSPQPCPIEPVVDLVFSRWTTPILWMLNEFGRQRFVELERRLGTITPKVLTQRLRQLERDGLVIRTYHPEVPPRVEYEISALGLSLAPLFATLVQWSNAHLGQVAEARHLYDGQDPAQPVRTSARQA